jgi:cbb3-type cytochrome oxidase maturation protein
VNVLFFAIPIALFLSLVAVLAFVYLVRSGQFDDLETPPRRILFDDIEASRFKESSRPDSAESESQEGMEDEN